MEKPTLVVMAAGMGSRFGGIKQLTPLGPSGEIILDFSVYDAIEAGFEKVVFVIRKDLEEGFHEAVGAHLAHQVETAYAFQEKDDLPDGFTCPADRAKPWGTGQAILCCRDLVKGPFAVINADDYYGKAAFREAYNFLLHAGGKPYYDFAMVGFELGNTLSENGTVTRGVCSVSPAGDLVNVVETYDIRRNNGVITASDGKGGQAVFDAAQPVSMNLWAFTPEIFGELEQNFSAFLKSPAGREPKSEYLLPTEVDRLVQSGRAHVRVLHSPDRWFGVTYQEDKATVIREFARLTEEGKYPKPLWK